MESLLIYISSSHNKQGCYVQVWTDHFFSPVVFLTPSWILKTAGSALLWLLKLRHRQCWDLLQGLSYAETIYLLQMIKFISNYGLFSPYSKAAQITLFCLLMHRLLFHCISTSSGLFDHCHCSSAPVAVKAAGVPMTLQNSCPLTSLPDPDEAKWTQGKHGRKVEQDSLLRGRLLWIGHSEGEVQLLACLELQLNYIYPKQVEKRCSLLGQRLLSAPHLLHSQVLLQLQTSGKKLT